MRNDEEMPILRKKVHDIMKENRDIEDRNESLGDDLEKMKSYYEPLLGDMRGQNNSLRKDVSIYIAWLLL